MKIDKILAASMLALLLGKEANAVGFRAMQSNDPVIVMTPDSNGGDMGSGQPVVTTSGGDGNMPEIPVTSTGGDGSTPVLTSSNGQQVPLVQNPDGTSSIDLGKLINDAQNGANNDLKDQGINLGNDQGNNQGGDQGTAAGNNQGGDKGMAGQGANNNNAGGSNDMNSQPVNDNKNTVVPSNDVPLKDNGVQLAGDHGEMESGGEAGPQKEKYYNNFFDENGNLKPEIQDLCNGWYLSHNKDTDTVDLNTPKHAGEDWDEISGGKPLPDIHSVDDAKAQLPSAANLNGHGITEESARDAAQKLSDYTGVTGQDVNNFVDDHQDQAADWFAGH